MGGWGGGGGTKLGMNGCDCNIARKHTNRLVTAGPWGAGTKLGMNGCNCNIACKHTNVHTNRLVVAGPWGRKTKLGMKGCDCNIAYKHTNSHCSRRLIMKELGGHLEMLRTITEGTREKEEAWNEGL